MKSCVFLCFLLNIRSLCVKKEQASSPVKKGEICRLTRRLEWVILFTKGDNASLPILSFPHKNV